jgi:hypothetical protein
MRKPKANTARAFPTDSASFKAPVRLSSLTQGWRERIVCTLFTPALRSGQDEGRIG